jgi:hypothetical protein
MLENILFYIFSRSWEGCVHIHESTDLPKCINLIVSHGCTEKRSLSWVQRALDLISRTASQEQVAHVLNGYADLYKLVFYLIPFTGNMLVDPRHISTYGGTSSIVKQQKRERNIAFIMYNYKEFLFAPLYTKHPDGSLQTCFASGDKSLVDHIAASIRLGNIKSTFARNELMNLSFVSI